MFKDKIFPANTSANDILESCIVYVNNSSGQHNVNDVPADIGLLIVFKATPWWIESETCVAQLFLSQEGWNLYAYFRFKNNNRSFVDVNWQKVSNVS